MPLLAIRPSRLVLKLSSFALAFACVSLSASDASAQGGGGLRGHFRRFYGQDYYASGFNYFPHLGPNREFRGPAYGPAMIYGRQYGEQYGYATAPSWVLPRDENQGRSGMD